MITMIAAAAENNALGKNNTLLWHLPDDFKRFKRLTTGHYIIMGRKTFESFPNPLPNRTHIIITRQKNFSTEGGFVVSNLQEALASVPKNEETFIIGGGEIYQLALDFTDIIELTRVHHVFAADTFFPKLDPKIWQLEREEHHLKDDRHLYDFTYQTFTRK
ncbi:MAG: dihydrofolate reductase [Burkholderiales bacterium]|nr:dihydrofolate reductase [Flavobacterium sp.]